MRILIVTENFWPDTFAINDVTAKLVKRGHHVTVLTGLPDYTTGEIPDEYQHRKNRYQNYQGADVIRVGTIPRKHGPIWRSLNYLSFWLHGVHAANTRKWGKFDIIFVWEVSPVTMTFPAIAFKKRYHVPLLMQCLDIWPECVKAMGFRENTVLFKIITRISQKAYKCCDHIAVSSKPFISYLHEIDRVEMEKMSYLPQYGSEKLLTLDLAKQDGGDRVDFLYIGNIGRAQGLEVLFEAIAHLNTSHKYMFHIVGGGSAYNICTELVDRLKIDDVVHFYGPIPFRETMNMYKKADACVFTLKGDTRIGDTLPGKVQTYMAAGKPIIAACNGAGREVIEEARCGRCVKAGDSIGFSEALQDFIEKPEKFINCGKNARKYFMQHFSENNYFKSLEEIMEQMVKFN